VKPVRILIFVAEYEWLLDTIMIFLSLFEVMFILPMENPPFGSIWGIYRESANRSISSWPLGPRWQCKNPICSAMAWDDDLP
jgi:hypothetical protein